MSVVLPDGTPITDTDRTVVRVISHTGGDYRVDVRDGRCDCPDATHRNATCKHQRRARIALGRQSVATDTLAAVDVDTTLEANAPDLRVATTDGGLIGAGDDAEILSDTDNPPRTTATVGTPTPSSRAGRATGAGSTSRTIAPRESQRRSPAAN